MMWQCYDDLTSNVCGCGSSAQHLVGRRCNWFLAAHRKHYVHGSLGINICPRIHFLHCCKYLQKRLAFEQCLCWFEWNTWMTQCLGCQLQRWLRLRVLTSKCQPVQSRGRLMSRRGGWNPPTAALWSAENDWEQRCHKKFVGNQHLLSHETILHTFQFRYLFHSTLPIQDFFPRRLQTSVPVYEGVSSLFIYIYIYIIFISFSKGFLFIGSRLLCSSFWHPSSWIMSTLTWPLA